MAKSVAITPVIADRLKAAAGAVDPNTVTVFEASAVTTKPLMKKGSIFEGATITRQTLQLMADYLNKGESVPLHTLHLAGYELPVGKLIYGEVFDAEDGSSQLRVQFYLENSTQKDLIASINAAVIDEVSVGVQFAKLLCSECGWDFKGDDATILNLLDRECANEHQIGKNGVHLNLSGVERWFELSLVSKGAAKDAKILDRSKQALTAEDRQRLAAAGRPPETEIVIATTKDKDPPMDTAQFAAELTKQVTLVATAQAAETAAKTALTASEAKVADLTAKLAAATAELTALKADDKGAAALATANTALSAAQAEVKLATDYLTEQAKVALTAAGKKDEAPAKDAKALIAQIDGAKLTLVQLGMKPGGTAEGTTAGSGETEQKRNLSAFKVKA